MKTKRCFMPHEATSSGTLVALEGCPVCGGTNEIPADWATGASALDVGAAIHEGLERATRAARQGHSMSASVKEKP